MFALFIVSFDQLFIVFSCETLIIHSRGHFPDKDFEDLYTENHRCFYPQIGIDANELTGVPC